MAFNYTRSQLLADINAGLRGKIGMISDQESFVNRVVREVKNNVALRSARRKVTLASDLFGGLYQYVCPTDIDGMRIIDIPAQAKRYDGSFGIVPTEQFNVSPRPGDIAFNDFNGVRQLLINSEVPVKSVILDTISDNNGWVAVGGANSITDDEQDFINGTGSVVFNIDNTLATTAGIAKLGTESYDLSEYLEGYSSAFVWVKITDIDDITNWKLRFGTDASNYYEATVTTQFDGTAFVRGWNLLQFSLTALTETGTVTDTDINYRAVFMTKATAKVSEVGYKVNYLVFMTGFIHDVIYYSAYGWQSSAGAYKRLSDDALDLLVADDTEYELFVKKGIEIGRGLTNFDMNERTESAEDYKSALIEYQLKNPDESLIMTSTYHQHA